MVHRRRRSGALKAVVVAALEAQRPVNRWSQRPVARAAVELGRERAFAAALARPELDAERLEVQPERVETQPAMQLGAQRVSAQPQEAARRHSARSQQVQPGSKPDAAEPPAAGARGAAGPPRDAAQERMQQQMKARPVVLAPDRERAERCRRPPQAKAARGAAVRRAPDYWEQPPDVRTRAAVADPSRCRRAADSVNSPPSPRGHERKVPHPQRITGECARTHLCIVADFSPTAHDYCTRVPLSPHRDMKTKYGERVVPALSSVPPEDQRCIGAAKTE